MTLYEGGKSISQSININQVNQSRSTKINEKTAEIKHLGHFINIKVRVSTDKEEEEGLTTEGANQVAGPASREVLAKPVHDS